VGAVVGGAASGAGVASRLGGARDGTPTVWRADSEVLIAVWVPVAPVPPAQPARAKAATAVTN